jgi:hypothetical protein
LPALLVVLAMAAGASGPSTAERVLSVGPGETYPTPSAAAADARDGDTVLIRPGLYRDCAIWRADRLTLEGLGQDGDVRITGSSCENKGLWVIKGQATVVRNVTLFGATSSWRNGAGIRQEGTDLLVEHSRFLDNENGILAGADESSSITIRDSRFERNGKCEPDCAHGIYAGRIGWLSVERSIFRDQRIGHHIKSRALVTEVSDSVIEDGALGTASYLINLPNGGSALIRGNRLQKGPRSDNPQVAIAIGEEGATNPGSVYLIQRNSFVSDLPEPTLFTRNRSPIPALLAGNAIEGKVRLLEGPGRVVSE